MDCGANVDIGRCSVPANHLRINRNILDHPGNHGKEYAFKEGQFVQRIAFNSLSNRPALFHICDLEVELFIFTKEQT